MRTSLCKGCGKPIVWARSNKSTKMIPLDPRPICYRIGDFDAKDYTAQSLLQSEAMVSHFNTCPKASEFSRKGKEKCLTKMTPGLSVTKTGRGLF